MGAAALKEAARHQVDPIEHSAGFIGALVGAAVGLAVGIAIAAATIVTGGGALVLLASILIAAGTAASITGLGKDIGALIGSFLSYDAGDIERGSPDVTVGGRHLQAARATDPVKCHSGMKIATGCETIAINGLPAARIDEETQCKGKIKEGCATVKYGGPSVQVLPFETPFWEGVFNGVMEAVDWLGFIGGAAGIIRNAGKFALRALLRPRGWAALWSRLRAAGTRAYDVANLGVFLTDKTLTYSGSWITDTYAYKAAKIAWGGVGLRNGIVDGLPRMRRWLGMGGDPPSLPPSTPRAAQSDLLAIPPPPRGFQRTEGGLLVPSAPAGYQRTPSGLLIPSQAPRIQAPAVAQSVPSPSPRVQSPILLPGALPSPAPRVQSLILSP